MKRWTKAEKVRRLNVAYASMLAESKRLGLPEAYKDDLHIHDRDILRNHLPDEFGWILRRCGTWLLIPPQEPESFAIAAARQYGPNSSEAPHFYWWDGQKLEEITQGELIERLLADWQAEYDRVYTQLSQDLINSWRAERIAKQYAKEKVDKVWQSRK